MKLPLTSPARSVADRVGGYLISLALAGAIPAACSRLHHTSAATVALLIILSVMFCGRQYGAPEAFVATAAGCVGFDYLVLPPRGFPLRDPENWITLLVFLTAAVITGQLAARSKQREMQAQRKRQEIENLYQLVNTLLDNGPGDTMTALANKIVEIFEVDGVAVYSRHTGEISRAGSRAGSIPDEALQHAAEGKHHFQTFQADFRLTPVFHAGAPVGSLGIAGGDVSPQLIQGIAGRVALGLARLYALEKTTEAEVVRRSEELKSAVLDALAHELRNPLNSLKLAATTLLSSPASGGPYQQEMLAIIDEEVDRMDRAIDEAVKLARSDAGNLSLNKEPRDLGQLILSALDDMRPLTSGRIVHVNVHQALPAAECDAGMIVSVLKQLVGNALKYSPKDSPLSVSAESAGKAIVIDVVDRGPGVAEDERERIFDKYYRGHAAKRGVSGTGLGLASAKCIVEAHGGEIWVTTPADGGAAFHVSLPANGLHHTGAV